MCRGGSTIACLALLFSLLGFRPWQERLLKERNLRLQLHVILSGAPSARQHQVDVKAKGEKDKKEVLSQGGGRYDAEDPHVVLAAGVTTPLPPGRKEGSETDRITTAEPPPSRHGEVEQVGASIDGVLVAAKNGPKAKPAIDRGRVLLVTNCGAPGEAPYHDGEQVEEKKDGGGVGPRRRLEGDSQTQTFAKEGAAASPTTASASSSGPSASAWKTPDYCQLTIPHMRRYARKWGYSFLNVRLPKGSVWSSTANKGLKKVVLLSLAEVFLPARPVQGERGGEAVDEGKEPATGASNQEGAGSSGEVATKHLHRFLLDNGVKTGKPEYEDEIAGRDLVIAGIRARLERSKRDAQDEKSEAEQTKLSSTPSPAAKASLLPPSHVRDGDFFWRKLVHREQEGEQQQQGGGAGVHLLHGGEAAAANAEERLFSHLVFLDADSVFLGFADRSMDFLLEQVSPSTPEKHILAAGDREAAANSGHLIFANTAVGRAMLTEWVGAIDLRDPPSTSVAPPAGDEDNKKHNNFPLNYETEAWALVKRFNSERMRFVPEARVKQLYDKFRSAGRVNPLWMAKHGLPCGLGGPMEGIQTPDQGPLNTLLAEAWSRERKFAGDHGARKWCRADEDRFLAERERVWLGVVALLIRDNNGRGAGQDDVVTNGDEEVLALLKRVEEEQEASAVVRDEERGANVDPNVAEEESGNKDCFFYGSTLVTNYCTRFATPTWIKTPVVSEKDRDELLAFAAKRQLLWAPFFTLVPQVDFNSYWYDIEAAAAVRAEDRRNSNATSTSEVAPKSPGQDPDGRPDFVFHAAGVQEHKAARVASLIEFAEGRGKYALNGVQR